MTTIVYSAFSTQLQITGDAIVRSNNDIRVTNIKVLSQTNNAYETYNNKYTKDTTSMFVTLPSNSSITYEVDITDKVNVGYIIEQIETITNSNANINVDIGLNQYDLVNANSVKKFNIKFTNNTNEEQKSTLVLKYHYLENRFIVTFDANGGSVDTLTKEVVYGSNYGELPTPTRDGYTFKGWNGKNLLNLDVKESFPSDLNYSSNTKRNFKVNSYIKGLAHENSYIPERIDSFSLNTSNIFVVSRAGYGLAFPLYSNDEMEYTVSYNANSSNDNDGSTLCAVMFYQNDGTFLGRNLVMGNGNKIFTFNTPENTYYIVVNFINNLSVSSTTFSNIQLEYGNKKSEYETFYVLSNTKVTQMKNHTLKAIWEENQ